MRHIVAIFILSLAAMSGAHATNDNDVQQGIFDSYLKLANEGDVVAQYVVAQRYETGKGTEKDMEKALYWYEKAAENNYPLALVKLEQYVKKEPAKEDPPIPAKAPPVVPEPKPVPTPAAKPAKKEVVKKPSAPAPEAASKPKAVPAKEMTTAAGTDVKPPSPPKVDARTEAPKGEVRVPAPEVVVAKAPPAEPPAPMINVMQTLLAGKWMRNQQEAEYLPSSRATCLQSGNTEIVCFSRELTRNISNSGLTYSVKSVISGINNKEGKFNLRYVYNVVDISGTPHANPNGMPNEINDMAVKSGWQEPGVTMECRLLEEYSLSCTRNDRKMTYQFIRE